MSRFVTRVFDRFFTPRLPEPYAGPTHRWLVWLLLCAVMLVFPGLAFLSALIGLADVIAGRPVDPLGDYSVFLVVFNVIFTAVLIAMVWGSLRLTGDRIMRIGLVATPVGRSVRATWWTFVWIFALTGLFQVGLSLLIAAVPYTDRLTADVQLGADVSFAQLAAAGIPASICAGLLEEIVVLGFAYRMLERIGRSDRAILVVLVALRMSFHVYYGIDVIVLLPWAYLSVIYYRRYRRLWPLIVGHAAWDIYAILSSASVAAEFAGLGLMLLMTLAAVTVAILRWLEVRRAPLLTLEIPRPRPAWIHAPSTHLAGPPVQQSPPPSDA